MKFPSKILVLSYYYPPDLSAGSFRAKVLVDSLLDALPESSLVEVITTQPNRYEDVRQSLPNKEILYSGRLVIHRISVPYHGSGMLGQIRGFIEFGYRSRQQLDASHFDILIATSSRLATAALGSYLARRHAKFCYLDIRDIFTDNIEFAFPAGFRRFGKFLFSRLEARAFRSAGGINLVSRGFGSYFEKRYPNCNFDYFSNGVDVDFIGKSAFTHIAAGSNPKNKKKRLLYAGNIGAAQGLDRIIPQLACMLGENYEFVIIGDGGAKSKLIYELDAYAVDNVQLLAPVSRKHLLHEYSQADLLFLHLNDFAPLRRVIPSKVFEYAATGKPILAGVSGYASKFMLSEIDNVAVFNPCDAKSAFGALSKLRIETINRVQFVKRFDRKNIMRNMVLAILKRFNAANGSSDNC